MAPFSLFQLFISCAILPFVIDQKHKIIRVKWQYLKYVHVLFVAKTYSILPIKASILILVICLMMMLFRRVYNDCTSFKLFSINKKGNYIYPCKKSTRTKETAAAFMKERKPFQKRSMGNPINGYH